ncbi:MULTISPECIES: dCTP deaminase [Haloarcula]|uniref:dCTP deaminase n=3 Tax=Haloarcula TaxID=2237 RepID=A0ACC6VRA9_9EURY|nr:MULTISPECIES: dCTP deaminase [Haloarcula]EMA31499.1 deoxycytidine triphosphate deaminase [Haloarcula japonica DSM 6131]
MMLSDVDIKNRLEDGDLVIEPLADPDLQIQPATVDVRLGQKFRTFNNGNISCVDPTVDEMPEKYTTEVDIEEDGEFILHAGEFVLGTLRERVEIPRDLVAHLNGRSSMGRLGVVVHATAGVVDPGFKGELTLELSNLGNSPVALHPDMRIAQLSFQKLQTPAERPYGHGRESKYQNQLGPQATRLQNDPEFIEEETDSTPDDTDGF